MTTQYRSLLLVPIILLAGCEEDFYSSPSKKDLQIGDPKAEYTVYELLAEFSTAVPADILFVIDNSGSMESHQKKVKDNMEAFIGKFSQLRGLDWKMGLLSSDENDTPYAGFSNKLMNSQDPSDVAATFEDAVDSLGTSGSSIEKFTDPVKKALNNDTSGFVRNGALLDFVFITDTNDQSSQTAAQFLSWLSGKYGSKKTMLFGAFNPPEWGCTQTDWKPVPSGYSEYIWSWGTSMFQQLISAGLPAKPYSLCADDFGSKLLAMADDLVFNSALVQVPLQHPNVIAASIVIKYGEVVLVSGTHYTYDAGSNKISFLNLNFASDGDVIVKIYYQTN